MAETVTPAARDAAPVARSPIMAVPPVVVLAGWQVSARQAAGGLTVADCTPLAKVQIRAGLGGAAATALDVPFGRAARDEAGTLVVGAGPGEWLLLAPPGHSRRLLAAADAGVGRAAEDHEDLVTAVDLTHGRALIRLRGALAGSVLARVSGIDLSDAVTPDGAALRTSVAGVAADIIRDDDRGTRSYLLHCERSSGQYLFDALLGAGAEYGLEVTGFTLPGI